MMQFSLVVTFVIGYFFIILEEVAKVNKAAVALVIAVVCWGLLFAGSSTDFTHHLETNLAEISQIVFFLLGAMAIVELIDQHQGFAIITRIIHSRTKYKMMWVLSLITFFMSAILDNLTTTIVMISLLRKLVNNQQDRWVYGSLIVIAANAGGAWTPIGDVTTTMLWINGQISAGAVMKGLFIPSFVSLVVSVLFQMFLFRKREVDFVEAKKEVETEPHGGLIFFFGIAVLIAVPFLKMFLHIPPFMGVLVGLGAVWLLTDLLHHKHQDRKHLRLPTVIQKVDVSSVLFFLGILLSISALASVGVLKDLANWIGTVVPSEEVIAASIGLASAIVDNVPLVAACMGMYDLQVYAMDCRLWQMIAYCAGTGGSILIIGSAAGVAFMGIERVDFFWYLKNVSLTAAVGYFAGFATYLILSSL